MPSPPLGRAELPLVPPPPSPPVGGPAGGSGDGLASLFRSVRYVTLKVTNGCNLSCTYCNVEADRPSTPRMPLGVFRRVAELALRNAAASHVGIEFHGGEPLLLSDAWFREAVGYARALADEHGKAVVFPLQTNGTLLTEGRLDVLLSLGIRVGLSLDGPPAINDRVRGSGRAAERALALLVGRGQRGGIILVLSRANCADMAEVMEYFRAAGVRDYRINFAQPQGRGLADEVLTAGEMFLGVTAVFEHMHRTGCEVVEAGVELAVNRFVRGRSAHPPLTCWELECQAGRTYVAVNHRGDIYACGTDLARHRLGHVDDGLDAAAAGTVCRLHTKDEWYVRCFGCEARRVCTHSCATSDFNNSAYREAECEYTRRLYRYFAENADQVTDVYETLRRVHPTPCLR